VDLTDGVLTATPNAGEYSAPINQFFRLKDFVSPDYMNVVRISRSGLWSVAVLDLDKEPLVLSNPDTKGRYFVIQLMNMWTDQFGSAGSRTTGTGPGNFLIAGPKWTGTAPSDIKEIFRSSTHYAWVLIQTLTNGPQEIPEVIAIEDQYKLTPLSAWGKSYAPPKDIPVDTSVDTNTTPIEQLHQMDAGTFFKRLAILMKDNPPYVADAPMLDKLKEIGVEPGKDFDINKIDPAVARGLNRSVKDAWSLIVKAPLMMQAVNGWINPTNLGNYGTDYNTRAAVAWLGLGALAWHDAVYPTALIDSDGKRLDGDKQVRSPSPERQRWQLVPTEQERELVYFDLSGQLLRPQPHRTVCYNTLDATQVQCGWIAGRVHSGRLARC
jgi:hypothetical protein